MKYNNVFVAGTFEGLHKGHEAVLQRAFAEGNHVTVGVTSDLFVKHFKESPAVAPHGDRKQAIEQWVSKNGLQDRTTVIDINDSYEPAASGLYDGLVITEHNKATGEKINFLRNSRSLPSLTLLEVAIIPAEDGKAISSTRIRAHEIDASGKLVLPDHVRPELKEPMGDIIGISDLLPVLKKHEQLLITVGDVTTDRMLVNGVVPDLSIIDLHAKRLPYKPLQDYQFPVEVTKVSFKSGPGYIAGEILQFLSQWEKKPQKCVLVINGEDDLLVLPAVVFAPLNTIILYGQPDRGIVRLTVTEDLKHKAQGYLEKFTKG